MPKHHEKFLQHCQAKPRNINIFSQAISCFAEPLVSRFEKWMKCGSRHQVCRAIFSRRLQRIICFIYNFVWKNSRDSRNLQKIQKNPKVQEIRKSSQQKSFFLNEKSRNSRDIEKLTSYNFFSSVDWKWREITEKDRRQIEAKFFDVCGVGAKVSSQEILSEIMYTTPSVGQSPGRVAVEILSVWGNFGELCKDWTIFVFEIKIPLKLIREIEKVGRKLWKNCKI